MNLEILKHPNKYIQNISNYKLTYILHPRVITSDNFVYPWKSYVIYDEDRTNILPSKEIAAFHNVTDSWIFNMLDIGDDVKILKPECKLKVSSLSGFIKKYTRNSKTEFHTYIPGKRVKWSDDLFLHNPLIISYNLFTEAHMCKDNYKTEMKKEVDKFYTKLLLIHKIEKDNPFINKIDKTTLKEILKINKKYLKNKEGLYFIYFKLPKTLPPFPVYWKYRDNLLDTGLLKYMTSQERIQLFMLFKLLASAGSNDEYDIFNYLNVKELAKTHLVFELDNKITTTPLYFLISLIKGIDIPDFLGYKTKKYDRKLILKVLYKHLLEIYKTPSFTITDIVNNSFISKLPDSYIPSSIGSNDEHINIDEHMEKVIENLDKEDADIEDDTINLEDIDIESEAGDILEETTDTLPVKKNEIINPKRKDSDLEKDIEAIKESIENISHKPVKQKAKKALKELEELPNKEIEIDGKRIKLKEFLKIDKKELELREDEITLPDTKVIFDKDYLRNPVNALDEKYIKEIYHKDAIRTIVSFARAGFVPKKIDVKKEESVLGDSYIYDVEFVDLAGKTHKVSYKIPVVNPEGTFVLSGNTYRTRKVRVDAPIKKLSWNKVMLSSAYGKIFVEKAPLKKYDVGYKIKKYIAKMAEDKVFRNVVFGSVLTYDVDYPTEYSMLGRYVKSFFYRGDFFIFDYENRKHVAHSIGLTDKDIETYEKDGRIFLGYTNKKEPMFINKDNEVLVLTNKKFKTIGRLFEILEIDPSQFGEEYAFVKIVDTLVPVAILLIYEMGLKNLLDFLNVKYTVDEKAVKDKDVLSLKFSDKVLNIKLETDLQKMIIYSLIEYKKHYKHIPLETMEDNTSLTAFLMDIGYTINVITEIKTLGPLYVDPVTATILELMGEPTTFTGLLMRASEMLLNDSYKHPNDAEGFRIRGYDTIHSLTYKQIVTAIKKKMGEDFFSSGKVSINPYEIEKEMNTDSASVLVDDLNPVAYVKQKEDTTFIGLASGRKKESMSKSTRVFHPSDTGVISEAVKDSGDVGITAYMSASPLIKNLRGEKDKNRKPKFVNMISTPGMLMPFTTHDDGKRANFTQIQMAHLVPIEGSQVFPVRTGYDTLLAYKLPKKYIGFAKDKGVVTNVTKNEVTVKYDNGEKESFPLTEWFSKEESFSTFKFELVPNVKKGDKVEKGQILTYCKQWFEPDMFDSKRVTFKQGIVVKTALQEIMETYEDSCTVTNRLVDKLTIKPVKARSIIITKDDRISNPLLPGDEVEPSTVLLTILGNIEGIEDKELTKEELELLQNFVRETPKAKYEGTIVKVKVFYNCKKSELNRTIKKLIEKVGDEYVDLNTGKKFTGEVNSSYSIKGRPLQEGEVEIKYYIETKDKPTTGDKFVFGNQLKTTIGEVFDYPIKTEKGEDVDALFSTKSIAARIVTSFMITGTTTTLLRKVTENAVALYFGEDKNED